MNATAQHCALVVGADGLIGKTLSAHLRADGHGVIETTRRRDRLGADRVALDLARPLSDWSPPRPPDTAYICAGVAAIKDCQDNPEETSKINVFNTLALINKLVTDNAFVVFLSTSGAASSAQDAYTRQKIEVEQALLSMGDKVAIVRLAKVFSPQAPLIQQWLECLAGGQEIYPFDDLTLAPLSAQFVARGLAIIGRDKLSGITSFSAARPITYADMARHMARRIGVSENLVRPKAGPSQAAQSVTQPNTQRMETLLGLAPPDPFDQIDITFGWPQDQPA